MRYIVGLNVVIHVLPPKSFNYSPLMLKPFKFNRFRPEDSDSNMILIGYHNIKIGWHTNLHMEGSASTVSATPSSFLPSGLLSCSLMLWKYLHPVLVLLGVGDEGVVEEGLCPAHLLL